MAHISDNISESPRPVDLRAGVLRLVFQSDSDGYAVVRMLEAGGSEFTACGLLSALLPGQEADLTGHWEKHPEFGRQFRVDSFRAYLPATPDGIKCFLSSGICPGIGPKLAGQIVDYFGEQTLYVLDNCSKRLREVPGVGARKAAAIADGWKSAASRRESQIYLMGLGISPAYCAKLFKRYGDQAAETVRKNPYRLAEDVDGIGFVRADKIALAAGIAPDSADRLSAAAVFCAREAAGEGHVCLPEWRLIEKAAELTGRQEKEQQTGLRHAVDRHLLLCMDGMVYTPALADAEIRLPKLVSVLARQKDFTGRRFNVDFAGVKMTLNTAQRQAVASVTGYPLCIITGGPGVGKTTVVSEIVRMAYRAKVKIALAAPTGRAAKRMTEATGAEAKTLHRLLGFDPSTAKFTRNAQNMLTEEILIIDECSMLDIQLASAVFRAIRPGTSVVLVGDSDQLPSVGPGTVLSDFIKSGFFSVTHLTEIFRQRHGSSIITNAHAVNEGKMPVSAAVSGGLSDFYWVEQDDPERVLDLISRLVTERIPARFGFDPFRDIQVLTPMNRGICGSVSINARLEELLNGNPEKDAVKSGDRLFRVGDRVMQISNDYDKNVFNGDMGSLSAIDRRAKKFSVRFDDRLVSYALSEIDKLVPAYAITVHKSQGSEFPAVVMPFLSQHYLMLQRNLLYTAMTRAKRLLIVIGGRRALETAVRNSRLEPRFSLLDERFRQLRNS